MTVQYRICEGCGKNVEVKSYNTHRRWHCKIENGVAEQGKGVMAEKPQVPDYLAIIEMLDATQIEQEIMTLEKRRVALIALLTVAKAKDEARIIHQEA